jgi:hypothetical protein
MSEHAKGLWALCWRMMLFIPVGLLGILTLILVVGLTAIPPLYAAIVFMDGRYLLGSITLALWLVWLRLGGRARRFVFDGFEHGSL